jgi:hypothetical protein
MKTLTTLIAVATVAASGITIASAVTAYAAAQGVRPGDAAITIARNQ